MEGTKPLRKVKNKLSLWKTVIDINRPLKTSEHMYEIFDMCEGLINEFEKIIIVGLDRPNTRFVILRLIEKIEDIFTLASSKLMQDDEFRKELEYMYENGLDKDADTVSIFNHYLTYTPQEKLEKMAKDEYSNIKMSYVQLRASFEKIQLSLS